jgi:hypothetical protein
MNGNSKTELQALATIIEGFIRTARRETGLTNPDVTLKAAYLEDYLQLLRATLAFREMLRERAR